jgi:hypothetical protein
MQLSDERLSFAQDLVSHWSAVRSGGLVPSEQDLDMRELQRIIQKVSIMDSAPDASVVVVMGQDRMGSELWPAFRDANWYDLIPPEVRDLAIRWKLHAASTITTPLREPTISFKRRRL